VEQAPVQNPHRIEQVAVGGEKKTEVTDFSKPFILDMQAKSPEELFTGEEHLLYLVCLVPIVFIGECDAFVINTSDTVVADSRFMGVASQIVD
jgi:hypothetical protein